MTPSLALLAAAWLAYAALHSLLASLTIKQWVARQRPAWMRGYRLAFNALASLLLIPLGWLTLAVPGEPLWQWQGAAFWITNGLAVLAVAVVMGSAGGYDMREFFGIKQWREDIRAVEDQENFHLSAAHHHVRHPWYSVALVLVWTRDMDPAMLLSALIITGYFVLGARLEERKLIAYHGDVYRRYRRRVPGLIPLPWKRLSTQEAAALTGGTTSGGDTSVAN